MTHLPQALDPLVALPHWVIWRKKKRGKSNKTTKVPYRAADPERLAASDNPDTWSDFATAVAASANADGTGFCLPNSNIGAFDIDDCRDPATGVIHPWAMALVERAGSYTEITPSGTGLRIIGTATGNEIHRKLAAVDSVTVELYRRAKRFITVTGDVLDGSAAVLADIDEVMDQVLTELDGARSGSRNSFDASAIEAITADDPRLAQLDNKWIRLGHDGIGIDVDDRSRSVFAFACECVRAGIGDEIIASCLIHWKIGEHIRDQSNVNRALNRVMERALVEEDIQSLDGRPVMKIKGGMLSVLANESEDILIDAGVAFYERSNQLARPIVKTVDTFHGKKTSVAQLARVEAVYMRDVLGRIADWYRFNTRERKWMRADPPTEVANTVLARAGEWKFPTIAGIITTQTMRPDGTILEQPGYDPATRLLLVDPPRMESIPENPTKEDALAALAVLNSLLAEFPLVDNVARAVALSLFITPVVRGAFSVTPMHVIDAPEAGAGKSYLLDVTSAIATGQPMPVIAAGRTEEETEKRLGSALLASQSLITIDNVNGELSGDALCQIIERPRPQVRILGKSELIDVETRGTTLFANGNNIVIVGDLCRRVIRVQLDPNMEQPELREFTGNPVGTVLADRGIYIAAALTVCRAYLTAGRPDLARRLASFEGWSDTVRSALTWLGQGDPVKSMDMSRAEDPDRGALRSLLESWAEVIGTGYPSRMLLKDVIVLIAEMTTTADGTPTKKWPELAAAVIAISGDHRYQPDAKALGIWLRSHKNRVLGNFRFEHKADPNKGSQWWAERTDREITPGKRGVM
jgi:hypothetical protein